MPFKYDAEGNLLTQEVNGQKLPIFVNAEGKESPFDGDGTVATISRLNGEAKSHRERFEKAETALKAFDGLSDPAAAIAALETVKNLNDKKLVDAGEVQKVKDQAIQSVRAEFEPVVKERDALKTQLFDEKIGGAFARSKFIGEKVAIPTDFVQATFGKHFTIEEGRIVAKDANGNQLFSTTRHGEPANFEEALSMLVDAHPQRDSILKGSGASGSGAQGHGGGGGKRNLSRAQFDALPPAEQGKMARDPNVTITD
ncbi:MULTISPECIES: DUF6651 domain-containing protein [unclassified Cupriavidus]|uniref:DUF6651 domain-containing protein n=1 Tax=unclassified Cupriavidus TaxID=2640874 RepID=UPI001C0053E1|nr:MULTISPECIES: DUF6651 domain-containing protein [unclassified Cupriavidus]MCA3183912.1 hypothetical protein [Cupriavidus sp.]MCA3194326.1 hypothetical protein [Cupriavidus sp.]MCA3200434.1 hypothetical protein [Cupriavidus sp.]MCA3233694.1 hypothetical protein [Cupriavidus sp.]QWE95330.1 hypothetical protein KLP38_05385 [Cupriavidus sp. EM10]